MTLLCILDSNFGLPDKSNAADFTSILQEYLTDPEVGCCLSIHVLSLIKLKDRVV